MQVVDFNQLTREQIEDILIQDDNLKQLYRLDIWLERQKADAFLTLSKERNEVNRNKIKNNLGWFDNLSDICKRRESDVKETNDRFNWRFRIKAQELLSEDIYNAIAEQARL